MNVDEGQVETILRQLGIDYEERDDELWAQCPNHRNRTGKSDQNPSWSINKENGVFLCFSCDWRGNLYSLVRDLRSPEEARTLLRIRRSTVDGRRFRPSVAPSGRVLDRGFQRPTLIRSMPKILPESSLALFINPPEWALDRRRLDPDIAKAYGVKWNQKWEEWILPLRDPESGGLLGYQAKAERERRFLNTPMGLEKGKTLFGYHAALEQKCCDKVVVVVESPLDAVLVAGLGCPAVAVCGSILSANQLELLKAFDLVGLALDNDQAGVKEMVRVNQVLRTGIASFRVPWLGEGKDFGEMEVTDVVASLEAGGLM